MRYKSRDARGKFLIYFRRILFLIYFSSLLFLNNFLLEFPAKIQELEHTMNQLDDEIVESKFFDMYITPKSKFDDWSAWPF